MGLRSSKLIMALEGSCSMGIIKSINKLSCSKMTMMMGGSSSGRRRRIRWLASGGGGSTSTDHDHHRGSAVPKGYVPISVGVSKEDSKRFVIHTTALGDADFLEFLCRSAEEYGFCNQGILRIPYEARAFEEWILSKQIAKHNKMLLRV